MTARPRFPSLYQINTRIWLRELTLPLPQPATFDEVPDEFLDQLAELGFDWFWPLGVWQTGLVGRAVSRSHDEWRRGFLIDLPDLTEDDISGSPFAVQNYTVHGDLGGNDQLRRFRERLHRRGIRLLLDFVPNHTAIDHPWVHEAPELYIAGTEHDLTHEPHNYRRVDTSLGSKILAHGRDPYFPGWPDTLQLNYRSGALRRCMIDELLKVAAMCDGVRCDMAMLLLPDVIQRTWGDKAQPADGTSPVDASFWPEAIAAVRRRYPDFLFMAEVYWDLEWDLQQQGFDYTYDKKLYDRLHAQDGDAVVGHLWADPEFQSKSVRFLENHDEPRAGSAFPANVHRAAAVIAFLVPGLHFFHEGQLEGRRQRISMHLGRRAAEPVDWAVREFYRRLLGTVNDPTIKEGTWQLLQCRQAWQGNNTSKNFIVMVWESLQGERLLVTVNYGPTHGQCYVQIPIPDLREHQWLLRDRLSLAQYPRDGTELATRGLYLDVPEWHYHVFDVVPTG